MRKGPPFSARGPPVLSFGFFVSLILFCEFDTLCFLTLSCPFAIFEP